MEISVDIEDVEEFVISDKFRDFLLENTTDFGTAAFILQSLLEAIDDAKNKLEETD